MNKLTAPNLNKDSDDTPLLRYDYDRQMEDDTHYRVDMKLAHDVGRILSKLYPGHLWATHPNTQQQTIQIRLPCFTDYCWNIHIPNVQNENDLHGKVKQAGGEFLEVFQQSRGKFDAVTYAETMQKLDMAGAGARRIDPHKLNLGSSTFVKDFRESKIDPRERAMKKMIDDMLANGMTIDQIRGN